jgi:hypothetical protein
MHSSHLMKPIHLMTFNESANCGDYESAAADESARVFSLPASYPSSVTNSSDLLTFCNIRIFVKKQQ